VILQESVVMMMWLIMGLRRPGPCVRRSHYYLFLLVCVCAVATTWRCHDDVHAVRCDHCHHYYNCIIVSIAIIFDIATIANLMSLLLNSDSTRICVTKMKTILAVADATTTSRQCRANVKWRASTHAWSINFNMLHAAGHTVNWYHMCTCCFVLHDLF